MTEAVESDDWDGLVGVLGVVAELRSLELFGEAFWVEVVPVGSAEHEVSVVLAKLIAVRSD